MSRDYEKRRFVETLVVAVVHARVAHGQPVTNVNSRDIVDKAVELWDEVEAQCPNKEKHGD